MRLVSLVEFQKFMSEKIVNSLKQSLQVEFLSHSLHWNTELCQGGWNSKNSKDYFSHFQVTGSQILEKKSKGYHIAIFRFPTSQILIKNFTKKQALSGKHINFVTLLYNMFPFMFIHFSINFSANNFEPMLHVHG